MREGIVFYRSFFEAVKNLPPEEFKKSVSAIMNYGLDGVEPEDTGGIERTVYLLTKPQIDANNKRYENGKSGGRKPNGNQNQNDMKPSDNQTETKEEPKANQNETKAEPVANQYESNMEPKEKDKDKVKDKDKEILSDASLSKFQCEEVIKYLNEKTGKSFKYNSKATQKHIKARMDEGFTLEEFMSVIDKKTAEWGTNKKGDDKDMSIYLRPETLFGTKFESYLNQKTDVKHSCEFEQKAYDFDKLEKELLSN